MRVIGERARVAAELFPVREFIREELEFRGIKAPVTIARFMDSDDEMTPKIAQACAALFATSADLWINLDRSHREWKAAHE